MHSQINVCSTAAGEGDYWWSISEQKSGNPKVGIDLLHHLKQMHLSECCNTCDIITTA